MTTATSSWMCLPLPCNTVADFSRIWRERAREGEGDGDGKGGKGEGGSERDQSGFKVRR